MRLPVFFVFLALTLGLASLYVHRRASGAFRLGPSGRRALGAALAAGFVAMALGRLGQRALPDGVTRPLFLAGNTVELAVLVTTALLLAVDFARGAAAILGWAARRLSAVAAPTAAEVAVASAGPAEAAVSDLPAEAPPVPRRVFLAQAAAASAFAVGSGSALYGAVIGRRDYALEEVSVPIPGLPRWLDGFAIVQLSDLHLGLIVGEREAGDAEDLVRRARGDLVVLTGDLVDHDPRFVELLGRLARRLQPLAREGVVAIPGNHDHYTGIDPMLATLRAAGADVLVNQGRVIGGGLALLGVDDVWGRRRGGGPDLARAIASVPRDLPRVLLCHNPVFFPEAAGDVALQLSGHTHGGQVNLGLRPADLVLPFGYVAGLYRRGDARLYVNRGFGTAGPPARIGAPPEVTRIVLTAA